MRFGFLGVRFLLRSGKAGAIMASIVVPRAVVGDAAPEAQSLVNDRDVEVTSLLWVCCCRFGQGSILELCLGFFLPGVGSCANRGMALVCFSDLRMRILECTCEDVNDLALFRI